MLEQILVLRINGKKKGVHRDISTAREQAKYLAEALIYENLPEEITEIPKVEEIKKMVNQIDTTKTINLKTSNQKFFKFNIEIEVVRLKCTN